MQCFDDRISIVFFINNSDPNPDPKLRPKSDPKRKEKNFGSTTLQIRKTEKDT
jgi:hypothetical protein